jgi:hypothetical protein
MIPIFTLWPALESFGPQSAGAPMKLGVVERSEW